MLTEQTLRYKATVLFIFGKTTPLIHGIHNLSLFIIRINGMGQPLIQWGERQIGHIHRTHRKIHWSKCRWRQNSLLQKLNYLGSILSTPEKAPYNSGRDVQFFIVIHDPVQIRKSGKRYFPKKSLCEIYVDITISMIMFR